MTTKGALINRAYGRLRISGLTVAPGGFETELGISRLENLANDLYGFEIDVGYNFEEDPNTGSPHNIPKKFWEAFETNLAIRLAPDFNKTVHAGLASQAKAGISTLSAQTNLINEVQYPTRHPLGSGIARFYSNIHRFYENSLPAPPYVSTVSMYRDDIENFTQFYEAQLDTAETLSSHTITAETGLTVSSESLSSPNLSYTVTADGAFSSGDETLKLKIVVVTSLGRQITRIITFNIKDSSISA